MTPTANWNYPTSVKFGVGRIKELADHCRAAGITRPLLVTDPGLAGLAMIKDAVAANKSAGIETAVFSDIQPNPIAANVEAGIAVFKQGKHDGVIAWGGGSAMDAAKAIAFMAGQSRPIWDFEDVGDNWTRADAKAIQPVIAVPTTSGTGSEVGRAAVITNTETHTKIIVFHPKMMPVTVICDPALVAGLPPHLTAWTGMDALAHCLEAYCAPGYHPLADGIAVEGLRLIKEWLPKAVKTGSDLEARAHMMSAAARGAAAFQKGLGAIHSLSHPAGSVYGAHHGRANAVFTPYVIAFNKPVIADKLERLARFLGLKGNGFDAVLQWTVDLRAEFEIPHTCDALGVKADDLPMLAKMAALDPTASCNPRPAGETEMLALYKNAMAGKVEVG